MTKENRRSDAEGDSGECSNVTNPLYPFAESSAASGVREKAESVTGTTRERPPASVATRMTLWSNNSASSAATRRRRSMTMATTP